MELNLAQKGVMCLVRCYQVALSPYVGGNCRFEPTCSKYMLAAVGRFGALRGIWLGAKRLMRCHPWCSGGYDPVPN